MNKQLFSFRRSIHFGKRFGNTVKLLVVAIFLLFFKFLHRVWPNIRTNEFFDILRQLNNSARWKKNKIFILSTEFSVVIFIQLPFLPMIKFSNTSRYDVIHQMFIR